MPAKGFAAQQVLSLWLFWPLGGFTPRSFKLCKMKSVFRDDRGNPVLYRYIIVCVNADIAFIPDDMGDAVLVEELALRSPKAAVIEIPANIGVALSFDIHVENRLHGLRAFWLDHERLVFRGPIPQAASRACAMTLQRALAHPALYLSAKLG